MGIDLFLKKRKDFPGLEQTYNGQSLVYMDSGATSHKPNVVIDSIVGFYQTHNSNVHRGIHFLADRADEAYLSARRKIGDFIGADDYREVIFTRNATEAINIIAHSWGGSNLGVGDEIVLSQMEHHSNIVPWQMIASSTGATLRYVELDEDGRLDLSSLESILSAKTKVVSLVHASNVLGVVNDISNIATLVKKVGALFIVDACQSVPHMKVDVKELGCDFMAFSGHKMCGPMGIGVLWGRKELLEVMPPLFGGGSMIKEVSLNGHSLADLPEKFDAGTPNVAGAVGLAAAVDYLDQIGWGAIENYEAVLMNYLIKKLQGLDFIRIIGPGVADGRLAIASFLMDGVHAHDVAEFLNSRAICVRAGHHCTHPLMRKFGVSATVRASLYFYNTKDEIDLLIAALKDCYEFFN